MAKLIDYARGSLKRALELAQAVDRLGGSCKPESAGDAIGMKKGGAYATLIGATVKYGLIANKKGALTVTQLYRDYKLAYNDTEKQRALRTAFMSIPLFAEVTKKFAGSQLPAHLDKFLIREHGVSDGHASRITSYFLEGAQLAGLADGAGNVVKDVVGGTAPTEDSRVGRLPEDDEYEGDDEAPDTPPATVDDFDVVTSFGNPDVYRVRLQGPGMDHAFELKDDDDLLVLDAMLAKIRKAIKAAAAAEANKDLL
jgi:hypothetical protein